MSIRLPRQQPLGRLRKTAHPGPVVGALTIPSQLIAWRKLGPGRIVSINNAGEVKLIDLSFSKSFSTVSAAVQWITKGANQ